MIGVHRVGDLAEEAQEFGFLAGQPAGTSVGASSDPAPFVALAFPLGAVFTDAPPQAAGIVDVPLIAARAGPVGRDAGQPAETARGEPLAHDANADACGAQPNSSPALEPTAAAVAAADGWDAASALAAQPSQQEDISARR